MNDTHQVHSLNKCFYFSLRNGSLEIFNIENVQKYMLKLLKWIKVAGIMIPKKNCQGFLQDIRIVLGPY